MKATIVTMKNGERIITVLEEVFGKPEDGEEIESKPLGLALVNPFLLEMYEEEGDVKVKFSRWCPYSIDTTFRIPYDVVMCIGNPDVNLEQAYYAKVEAQEKARELEKEFSKEESEEEQEIAYETK